MDSPVSNKFVEFFRACHQSKSWARLTVTSHTYDTFDKIREVCKTRELIRNKDYIAFGDSFRFASNVIMLDIITGVKDIVDMDSVSIRYENIDVDIT